MVENSNLKEHSPPVVMMADQRTMAELLRAPTEGSTQDVLTIIENKSKVRNSRSKPQTSVVTTAMMAMLKQFQATLPPAPVKAVEETCVTYDGAHSYYQLNDWDSDGEYGIEPLLNNGNEVEGDDEYASDVNEVPETVFEANHSSNLQPIDLVAKQHSADPFGLYYLINKQKVEDDGKSSPSLSLPPGFTSEFMEDHNVNKANDNQESLNAQVSYKTMLWDYISVLLTRWNGETIVMGDFNEVRSSEERPGSCFNPYGARRFDQFILVSGLVEINLEGYSFTWSHPSAIKMSKLDRFLVSDGIFSLFPAIMAICLDRHIFDHRPILFREVKMDFGPTPFRFYHSWFDLTGFDDMIKAAWHSFLHSDSNAIIRFKKKLQDLKHIIRGWVQDQRSLSMRSKWDTVNELSEIDKELDNRLISETNIIRRLELKSKLLNINNMESKDYIQKA
nr:RNA-directed DNA polymerase, eukaryota [Tanacetum cinerariifolium]